MDDGSPPGLQRGAEACEEPTDDRGLRSWTPRSIEPITASRRVGSRPRFTRLGPAHHADPTSRPPWRARRGSGQIRGADVIEDDVDATLVGEPRGCALGNLRSCNRWRQAPR
jgi:hypothetical protein